MDTHSLTDAWSPGGRPGWPLRNPVAEVGESMGYNGSDSELIEKWSMFLGGDQDLSTAPDHL